MASEAAPRVDDFLAWEERQELRYERLGGVVTAMTGGTVNHSKLAANAATALRDALRGSACEALGDNVKVATPGGDFVYSDAAVVCGGLTGSETVIRAPVVVVEVLSRGTEARDRGRKFEAYRSISSLRHYVLILPDERLVEVFSRRDDGSWADCRTFTDDAAVELPAIGVALALDAVYDSVRLPGDQTGEAAAG